MLPSRNRHGWDILEVFPIRGDKLGDADSLLSPPLRNFCQKRLDVLPSRNRHGWDILEVFPIRGDKLGDADGLLSQKLLCVETQRLYHSHKSGVLVGQMTQSILKGYRLRCLDLLVDIYLELDEAIDTSVLRKTSHPLA